MPISAAPLGLDLEACVIEKGQVHALIFPCRRSETGWIDASTKKIIDIEPTHWRVWIENR